MKLDVGISTFLVREKSLISDNVAFYKDDRITNHLLTSKSIIDMKEFYIHLPEVESSLIKEVISLACR